MEGVIDPPSSALRLTPDQLAQKAETETCFAIMQDGLPLACLFCDRRGDTLYVGKLAVDPVHHGKGLATRLIQEAEALARRLGCRQLELQTRVELVDNHRFFAARGFRREVEGAHDGYMRPTWIVMRRQVYPA